MVEQDARFGAFDETKASFKSTEFWAMVVLIVAILIASAVSDSLGDVQAWTLIATAQRFRVTEHEWPRLRFGN